MFEAIVFAIMACGFRAVTARSRLNSAESRISKILELIAACKYSIHDLSRVELDSDTHLPRFNMPLELGIDLGCRHYLKPDKVVLILDAEKHRYQRYISDLAGQDVAEHRNSTVMAVGQVRNWLRAATRAADMPGSRQLLDRYIDFREKLPEICRELGQSQFELTLHDYCLIVRSGSSLTREDPTNRRVAYSAKKTLARGRAGAGRSDLDIQRLRD